MNRVIKPTVIMLALAFLAGCIEVDTVIKIKKDGSGTIEEAFVMSKVFIQQMQAMATQMGAMTPEGEAARGFDVFDEAKLQKRAMDLGEGVTFLKGKKIVTDMGEGYQAIFSFKDINKLKINQKPSGAAPSGPGGTEDKEEFVTFEFKKGRPATLIVRMPEQEDEEDITSDIPEDLEEAPPPPDDANAAMMAEQMKQMFQGMRISMAIEVEGSIIETNATHREGSRVILMEMDFGKLLEDPEKFKKFTKTEPGSLEEAKEVMKDLPGIKVELNPETKILICIDLSRAALSLFPSFVLLVPLSQGTSSD